MNSSRYLGEIERQVDKISNLADREFPSNEFDEDLEEWCFYDSMCDKLSKLVDEIRSHEYNKNR